ncbi:hypothetical protein NPIL_350921 [Nephila pilipes]|uniref:Uncharacterized protein n=1 Tax=Nephila pilipes TaxID=299642 RepID=A0A8X6JWJ3_NEPPI|nr:hypothetical protein NPIL_350921 [Nephila pilipes]
MVIEYESRINNPCQMKGPTLELVPATQHHERMLKLTRTLTVPSYSTNDLSLQPGMNWLQSKAEIQLQSSLRAAVSCYFAYVKADGGKHNARKFQKSQHQIHVATVWGPYVRPFPSARAPRGGSWPIPDPEQSTNRLESYRSRPTAVCHSSLSRGEAPTPLWEEEKGVVVHESRALVGI